jgi:hypothetical protein
MQLWNEDNKIMKNTDKKNWCQENTSENMSVAIHI